MLIELTDAEPSKGKNIVISVCQCDYFYFKFFKMICRHLYIQFPLVLHFSSKHAQKHVFPDFSKATYKTLNVTLCQSKINLICLLITLIVILFLEYHSHIWKNLEHTIQVGKYLKTIHHTVLTLLFILLSIKAFYTIKCYHFSRFWKYSVKIWHWIS